MSALPLALLLLAAAPAVQDAAVPAAEPTTVAFVGDLDTPRSEAFADFLRARFETVHVVAREGLDPRSVVGADVVLLDWDQQAGVMRWFEDRDLALEHPLGERAEWATPTVLLGSAGLNTAAAWDVRGGSG